MAASAAVILILKEKYRVCNIQNLKFDLPKLSQPSNIKPQSTTTLYYDIKNILLRKKQLLSTNYIMVSGLPHMRILNWRVVLFDSIKICFTKRMIKQLL